MKVADLKSFLDSFDGNKEMAISVLISGNKYPVISYDIGYHQNEFDELVLNVSVYESDHNG